jgi:hypothetical protein
VDPTLPKEIANQIWTILVEEAGSREDERSAFVYHQGKGCSEFRIGGPLGYGGKFWHNNGRWYINTYPETLEREPALSATIERVNKRLESLRAGLVDNRLPA